MSFFLSLLFFMFVSSLQGWSQTQDSYFFRQLSVPQGLSNTSVRSCIIDRNQEFWIGTDAGLNHFSHKGLKSYSCNPNDSLGLTNNYVLFLAEDKQGTLWVSTYDGLCTYCPHTDKFYPARNEIIYCAYQTDQSIFFGSDNKLLRFDFSTRNFTEIPLIKTKDPLTKVDYRVLAICSLKDGRVLLGTKEKGVFAFDPKTERVTPFIRQNHHLLLSMLQAGDGRIYLSVRGDGVYAYDADGTLREHFTSRNSGLSYNLVLAMLEHDGELWMATDGGGISIYDYQHHRFRTINSVNGNSNSLPVNSITCLLEDDWGSVWAGTVRGGLINIRETQIHSFGQEPLGSRYGLSNRTVISTYEENDGKLWIGTDGGGLNLYDENSNLFTHYPNTMGKKVISVTGMNEDELLMGVFSEGFMMFNKKTGRLTPLIMVNDSINRNECLFGYLALAHRVASDKIYFMCTHSWVYSIREKRFKRMVQEGVDMAHEDEGLVLCCSNERFSLARQRNQIYIISQEDDVIRRLYRLEAGTIISTVCLDEENRIWISTNKGLGVYDLNTKKYRSVPTPLFTNISDMLYDNNGRLWISAHNQLFSYLIKEDRFMSWGSSDGYTPNGIVYFFHNKTDGKYLYMGGSEGLVRIDRSIKFTHKTPVQIELGDVYLNGSPYWQTEHGISFPWDYRSFALNVRLKGLDLFESCIIKYTIVQGGGKGREIVTKNAALNLPSLSPGKYEIYVSCNTKDGHYTDPVLITTITVTPPWYKSTWFTMLLVLLLVAGLVVAARIFVRKRERLMKSHTNEFLQVVLTNLLESKDETENHEEHTSVDEGSEETGGGDIQVQLDETVEGLKDDLSEIDREQTEEPKSASPVPNKADEQFLEKLNELILDNLATEDLSVVFLVDKLGMSRASLYNKLKQLTGMGVNDYINRLRIERSVYLLTQTDMNINEISYEVGFRYPRYFSTSFKQFKGVTPSEYKKENRKE